VPTATTARSTRSAELIALMDEEIRLYDAVLTLTRDEREATLGTDPAVLDAIVAAKESLVAQVTRVEVRRQAWVAEWAAEHGVESTCPTLSSLVAQMNGPESQELAERREQLLARVHELADLNFRNKQLFSSALSVISRRLEAYERVTSTFGYRSSGRTVKNAATAVLDMRA
jgi:flagellar biosynthesis/type III secretory pathway chaperone